MSRDADLHLFEADVGVGLEAHGDDEERPRHQEASRDLEQRPWEQEHQHLPVAVGR